VRLKKFELLNRLGTLHHFFPPKNFHHPELFIGNAHNPDMSFGGKNALYSFYMHVCIFPAGTVAQVNAELEHIEPIGHNILAEFGVDLPVLFGFRRQVEKYKYPHDAVCVKAFKHC